MNPVIMHWLFGVQLMLRLLLVLFCLVSGPVLVYALRLALVALAVEVPAFALVMTQLFSIVVVGPLLLADYSNYCRARPVRS
jgi:hypothetical protein